jgi:hypothetical protein
MYVHYTDPVSAANIVATGELRTSLTIVDAVYAVVVGGRNLPAIQHDRTGSRSVAVVFDCDTEPDTVFPEECIWHRNTPLPLRNTRTLAAADAERLLDDGAGIPADGVHRQRVGHGTDRATH